MSCVEQLSLSSNICRPPAALVDHSRFKPDRRRWQILCASDWQVAGGTRLCVAYGTWSLWHTLSGWLVCLLTCCYLAATNERLQAGGLARHVKDIFKQHACMYLLVTITAANALARSDVSSSPSKVCNPFAPATCTLTWRYVHRPQRRPRPRRRILQICADQLDL